MAEALSGTAGGRTCMNLRQIEAFKPVRGLRAGGPRVVMEAPMAPALCALVARGLGVSIVNPIYVGAFAPALAVRPFRPRIGSEIFMALPRSRRLSALGEAFAQTARELAREVAARDGTITFRYG